MGSLRHTRSGRQADSTPGNDRFAALVRQAGAGIAQVDSAGRFMLTNQRFHDILGRSAEDLKTLRARDIVHPDDRHDFDARFQCLFREGRDYVDERRYLRPDGVTVWATASVVPVLDEAGRPQSAVAVIQDITERKRAEAELRRSDATLRLIADNVEAVFWIEDLTARRKIYVSPRYELLWGRPAERLYQNAEDWLNSIHPEDRQRTEAAFRRGMTAGHYDEIFRVVLPNGGIRWIRDRGWTVPDPTGETRRAVGIAEDVTEHHTAEELQRTLIAELNHRVRNTLAVVQAIAHQTIRQSPSMDAFAESFIGRVQALADVHSLLTHTQWRSADLKTILESALRPYDAGRTEFDGPDLELPGDRVTALSAGTRPKARLHPETARVLAGYGIDVAGRRPRGLDAHHGRRIDWLITLCDRAREACPELPQRPRRSHWSIPDPAAAPDPADAFARTAADIERRVRHLLPVLDPPGGPP